MTTLTFDISQDELPIFLAEADEHLQELDDALVRLERQEQDEELLQYTFRAAHTLKGMAGMIAHARMVNLTHMLETAFDQMRKKSLPVSTPLIDLCLKAVDGLRALKDEILTREPADIDLDWFGINFSTFMHTGWMETLVSNLPSTKHPAQGEAPFGTPGAVLEAVGPAAAAAEEPARQNSVEIQAYIARGSVSSAARAFQLMMALQEMGEILRMEPSMEEIDRSVPVQIFRATLATSLAAGEICRGLKHISEVEKVVIGGEEFSDQPPAAAVPEPPAQPALQEPDRLGEYLVSEGLITQQQLEHALAYQLQNKDKGLLIGRILVAQGAIESEKLNQAITQLVQTSRPAARREAAERGAEKTVRTSVERLDNLMNLVGELITDRNRLAQVNQQLNVRAGDTDQLGNLTDTVAHFSRIIDHLQEEVMRIRMVPITNVFNKFPRLVRDLAQKTGKDIELVIRGQDTELDRSVIEEINDPLIHLIRNAVDHGIEAPEARRAAGKPARGVITLRAHQEQGRIILTVEDDGAGIDPVQIRNLAVQKGLITEVDSAKLSDEKSVDLIFLPGFSTSETVTAISGRGVGMDIVRSNVNHINGSIQVDTHLGSGTSFQIILPLTLAIVPTLLVGVAGYHFAIPLVMVVETQQLRVQDIHLIHGKPIVTLRDQVLPLVYLDDAFNLGAGRQRSNCLYLVVVRSGKITAGIVVDRLFGEEEVVVKSLGPLLKKIPGISSATIMGDGEVCLIMDVPGLFKFLNVD